MPASVCFRWLTKPSTFMPDVMNKPLFAESVLGSTLLLCVQFLPLMFFLGSILKGFTVLKSGNSVSG